MTAVVERASTTSGFRWAPWRVVVSGPGFDATVRCWTKRAALREADAARAKMSVTVARLRAAGRWGVQAQTWAQQHTVVVTRSGLDTPGPLCPEAWA